MPRNQKFSTGQVISLQFLNSSSWFCVICLTVTYRKSQVLLILYTGIPRMINLRQLFVCNTQF